MLKEKDSLFRKAQLFSDLALIVLSFFVAYFLRSHTDPFLAPLPSISYHLFLLYIILPLWTVLLYYTGAYKSIRTLSLFQAVLPVLKTAFAGCVALMTILFIFKQQDISRGLILLFFFSNVLVLAVERICIYYFFHHIRGKGYNYRTVLVVGTGKRARGFARNLLSHRDWGLKIVGFVDMAPSFVGREIEGKKVIGVIEDIPAILTREQIDEVIFVGPRKWLDHMEKAVRSCEEIGVVARVACDFFPSRLGRVSLDTLLDLPLLTLTPPPHYGELFTVKRAMDVVFSAALLLAVSPLLLFIVLGIKLTSPGPVLFKQERCGQNGRRFELLKFRTMVVNAEELRGRVEELNEVSGPVFKVSKDPRITPFGKFLRKSSLDELPQFINVLRGEMSVVGPRPPLPREVEQYEFLQRRRLSVRPGITCLWQVKGRNNVDFKEWVKLDLKYIDNWSLGLDLKIILKTIPAVLRGTGV